MTWHKGRCENKHIQKTTPTQWHFQSFACLLGPRHKLTGGTGQLRHSSTHLHVDGKFSDTAVTYLSATRTELSSCPVVMIPYGRFVWKKNKKQIFLRRLLVAAKEREKKCALPGRTEQRSCSPRLERRHFKTNTNIYLNGVFTVTPARRWAGRWSGLSACRVYVRRISAQFGPDAPTPARALAQTAAAAAAARWAIAARAYTHTCVGNAHTRSQAPALCAVYAPGREPQCVTKPRPLLGNCCEMTS